MSSIPLGATIGRYRIVDFIGKGGFAAVYRAYDPELEREVALKVLAVEFASDQKSLRRFKREAKAAASLDHPNIVTVYDVGVSEHGQPYLVMELLPGETLRAIMDSYSALQPRDIVDVVGQIASALDYIHDRELIHCDVTPKNIIVESGHAVLTDFGIVRVAQTTASDSTQNPIGTPPYMAPEQIDRDLQDQIGPAADVYALATITYELLVGRRPFFEHEPAAMIQAKLNENPPRASQNNYLLSPQIDEVLSKGLERTQGKRLQRASVFATELRRALLEPELTPSDMIGKYLVRGTLRHGDVTILYEALDPHLDRKVAIKVLHPQQTWSKSVLHRFEREAQTAAKLKHPNIVQVYEFGKQRDGRLYYIVMEFLEGFTFEKFLSQRHLLDVKEALPLLRSIASAIDYLHRHQIIHCQITPDNIIVDQQNMGVTLTDFGLARMFDRVQSIPLARLAVTTAYLAPEILGPAESHSEITPQTDIYSLGAIAYRVLTGSPPYSEFMSSYLEAKRTQEPSLPSQKNPGLTSRVDDVLLKAMSCEPRTRYTSAEDLLAELELALEVPQLELSFPFRPLALCTEGRSSDEQEPIHEHEKEDLCSSLLIRDLGFDIEVMPEFHKAYERVCADDNVDLVLIDGDISEELLIGFLQNVHGVRSDLPVVAFVTQRDPNREVRLAHLGVSWCVSKEPAEVQRLPRQIIENLLGGPSASTMIPSYEELGSTRPEIRPDPSIIGFPIPREDQVVLKKLFRRCSNLKVQPQTWRKAQVSHVYAVEPDTGPARVAKVEMIERLYTAQDKLDRLIKPRLDQHIGQPQGRFEQVGNWGGACYVLPGASGEAHTLEQFLLYDGPHSSSVVDSFVSQLESVLRRLYTGSCPVPIQSWAPLYCRVLPPDLTVQNARIVDAEQDSEQGLSLSSDDYNSLEKVIAHKGIISLESVTDSVRSLRVLLKDFSVGELNSQERLLYVQDRVLWDTPLMDIGFRDSDHPLLRFKAALQPSSSPLLRHPFIRRGKALSLLGEVATSRERLLRENFMRAVGDFLDEKGEFVIFSNVRFIHPLTALRYFLWEIPSVDPPPLISPVVHGDLNVGNIMVDPTNGMRMWLIDFADARYGHVCCDPAKLEVEIRTHVLFELFRQIEMRGTRSVQEIIQMAMMAENVLNLCTEDDFDIYLASVNDVSEDWYTDIQRRYPIDLGFSVDFVSVLYLLYSIREMMPRLCQGQFVKAHYYTSLFFSCMQALKYPNLDSEPLHPWAKRLAAVCALVAGTEAILAGTDDFCLGRRSELRNTSVLAVVPVTDRGENKYLLQWNPHWRKFNLIGGHIEVQQDEKQAHSAMKRELEEELKIKLRQDYSITDEERVEMVQFSERDGVHKHYDFRVFTIKLRPNDLAQMGEMVLSSEWSKYENYPASLEEILQLRTVDGRPISETTRSIFGRLKLFEDHAVNAKLA